MRVDAFLAEAERLPFADVGTIARGGGIVIVAPHPDDESLGCGGLIAAACEHGIAVRLVVVSDGVGSHPRSKHYPPARLKALREQETIDAMSALGLDADLIVFLGLPDASVPTSGPEAERARAAIVAAAVDCRAGAVCVTWRYDPHCDHGAAAALVEGARHALGNVAIWAYPIWGWSLPPETEIEDAPTGLRLDIAQHLPAKRLAIAAHRSQTTGLIDDDPDGFRLEPAMIDRFSGPFEIFLDTHSATNERTGRRVGTMAAEHFETMYRSDPDPWNFATSGYERAKYEATLAACPRPTYKNAFEIGCSIGVLTRRLAERCERLLSVDAAMAALDQARARCADLPNVLFELMHVPGDWPHDSYDLIVLSEVVYYLDRQDVERLAERIKSVSRAGGDIVLVHWLGLTDYPLDADEAIELLIDKAAAYSQISYQCRTDRYRLDVLSVTGVDADAETAAQGARA